MEFDEALARLGFQPSSDRVPRGARVLVARPNRYLTYTVQAFEDGTALFSWEFAVGEYLATRGIQFGSDETLNQFRVQNRDISMRGVTRWSLSCTRGGASRLRRTPATRSTVSSTS